jgi:MFS family permease
MVATVLMVKERPGIGGLRLPTVTFRIDIKAHRNFLRFMIYRLIIFIKAHRNFLWFLASRLFFFLAMAIIQRFALYFLQDVIGVDDPAEAVFGFSIFAVIGMLAVVYPAGRLSDRIGRKPIAVSSALLGALGIIVIMLFKNESSILIAAGILGIATGAFSSTNWALATDLVTKGKEARYLGLANMATAGAGALAGLFGPLIDHYEAISADLGYQVMLISCLVFFVIGALILLRMKYPVSQGSPAVPPSP